MREIERHIESSARGRDPKSRATPPQPHARSPRRAPGGRSERAGNYVRPALKDSCQEDGHPEIRRDPVICSPLVPCQGGTPIAAAFDSPVLHCKHQPNRQRRGLAWRKPTGEPEREFPRRGQGEKRHRSSRRFARRWRRNDRRPLSRRRICAFERVRELAPVPGTSLGSRVRRRKRRGTPLR